MTDSVHRYVQEEQWQCSAPILIDGGDTLSIGHWCPSLGANKSLCPRPRPSNAHRWIYSPLANNRMVIPPRWVTERWEIFALNPADSPLLLLCWQQCTESGDWRADVKIGRSCYLSNDKTSLCQFGFCPPPPPIAALSVTDGGTI